MTSQKKVLYWDSCSFIHRIQETPQYVEALTAQMNMAKGGLCKIVTSTVTLAEVCKLPEKGVLPIEQSHKIKQFFENDYVEMHQADRWVCEEAHNLLRLYSILPMDSIHLATALIGNAGSPVDILVTTDMKKYRRKGLLHLSGKVGNPPMKISLPDMKDFMGPLFDGIPEAEGTEEDEEEAGPKGQDAQS